MAQENDPRSIVILNHHGGVTLVDVCWIVARLLLCGGQLSSGVQRERCLWERREDIGLLGKTQEVSNLRLFVPSCELLLESILVGCR